MFCLVTFYAPCIFLKSYLPVHQSQVFSPLHHDTTSSHLILMTNLNQHVLLYLFQLQEKCGPSLVHIATHVYRFLHNNLPLPKHKICLTQNDGLWWLLMLIYLKRYVLKTTMAMLNHTKFVATMLFVLQVL